MGKFAIDVSSVDASRLGSERGIQSEADRLLPEVMRQIGEQIAAKTWDVAQKVLDGPDPQASRTKSIREEYIRDMGQHFVEEASKEDRRGVRELVVEQLRSYQP